MALDILSMTRTQRIVWRKAIWQSRRDELAKRTPVWPTIGTVYYFDPNKPDNTGNGLTPATAKKDFTSFSWPTEGTYLIKEGTTMSYGRLSSGDTTHSRLFGTYDATTGARIIDPDRLATYDGSSYTSGSYAFNIYSGSHAGTWVWSGLRIKTTTTASGSFGGIYSAGTTGSKTVVEHCIMEEESFNGTTCGTLLQLLTHTRIVRFNKLRAVGADLLWVGHCASGQTLEVYGNEFEVISSTVDGPDCVQVSRTTTNAVGPVSIHTNFFNHQANCKAAFIISGGTLQASGEEVFASGNEVFGIDASDTDTYPLLGGGQSHIAFNLDVNGATIQHNYFDGWAAWGHGGGGASNRARIAHNVYFNANIASGLGLIWIDNLNSDYCDIHNNTIITVNVQQDPLVIDGSNSTCRNNVIIGPWDIGIKCHDGASNDEDYNLIDGATKAVTDWSENVISAGTNTNVSTANIDNNMRPIYGGNMCGYGQYIGKYSIDISGRPYYNPPSIGAYEAIRSRIKRKGIV